MESHTPMIKRKD